MTRPRILVAGIGNLFRGDDAFGVEVAHRLAARPLPPGVRVVDFGIRGLDLAYAILDGYDVVILVDAISRGGAPGTLCVLEPDPEDPATLPDRGQAVDGHGMDLPAVFHLVRALGGTLPPLYLVGCEPAALGSEEDGALGLSEPVLAAVGGAIGLVEAVIATSLGEGGHA